MFFNKQLTIFLYKLLVYLLFVFCHFYLGDSWGEKKNCTFFSVVYSLARTVWLTDPFSTNLIASEWYLHQTKETHGYHAIFAVVGNWL